MAPSLSLATFGLISAAATILSHVTASPPGVSSTLRCVIPTWTVRNLTVTYSDDSFVPGNTTFTLVHSLTNTSEILTAQVPFNYRGRVNGTKDNQGLNITIEFGPGFAHLDLKQIWTCNDTPNHPMSPSILVAEVEVPMLCPDPVTENMTCTADPVEIVPAIVTDQMGTL